MAALLVHQHCSNAFDQNGKAASTGTDQGVTPVLQQPLICPAPGRFRACPQCRVYSSYIIPHKFWVSDGPEKEQLIRTFTARTRQIQCRFFMRGNGRCPFRSNCIYLHQLPAQALASSPPWAPGSEVLGSLLFPGATRPGEHVSFSGHVLAPAPWDSEFLLDHGNS
ncbi:Putative E3 ubiquitin-protein ligase makorin-1 [Fukomys damarensis]|uniref:RING-type E3 ubiquitin transferase n=1 Tax=Fukomys damarensis TaxID=885580 RepID=A0A091CWU1_FUKDA|nr:Putative E3 ubiquitin-protein ligase makorin-1 [Fukomys damarensis]